MRILSGSNFLILLPAFINFYDKIFLLKLKKNHYKKKFTFLQLHLQLQKSNTKPVFRIIYRNSDFQKNSKIFFALS